MFLCCNLVAVRFGLLIPAKRLVGKTRLLHQLSDLAAKIMSKMTYNFDCMEQDVNLRTLGQCG